MFTFYEFFAGGGMVRAGLGDRWRCTFANDFDPKKALAYVENWGASELRLADIATLESSDLPGQADLAWASFPCQDLSVAGNGAGLGGSRSGTFWNFWSMIQTLAEEGRAPSVIALENVTGAITSHQGRDLIAITSALGNAGYQIGALVLDAARFLPQSRPRLFIVASRVPIPVPQSPDPAWHPPSLVDAYEKLPPEVQMKWNWWTPPQPKQRRSVFADFLEPTPKGVDWHTPEETGRILSMMSPVNAKKVELASRFGKPIAGSIYKRTRVAPDGTRSQRAEVRFDDVAGCLRTPGGGSSRQSVILVDGPTVRTRLLSPREAARLMGLPDSYRLPEKYNDAYHLAGDGVAVPVVRFLSLHLLEPLVEACIRAQAKEAA